MKILICDDEENIRNVMKRFLSMEGIESDTAENGLSAERMLRDNAYDALLVDLRMPGLDGLSLIRWMKGEGFRMPVIMISAHGDITDAVTALKEGAADYIVKPFDPEELVIKIKNLVESTNMKNIVEGDRKETGFIGESAEMLHIRSIIQKHPPLSGGYDIQIHTYGPSRMIGTCNVEVPSDAKGEEIFDAMTDAQVEIMDRMGIYFTFGMYAVNSDNPVVILMKKEVLKVLKEVSPSVISIHAFHVHLNDSRVHFDVVVDFSLTDYATFRREASKALTEAFPTYSFQFNIDPDYA